MVFYNLNLTCNRVAAVAAVAVVAVAVAVAAAVAPLNDPLKCRSSGTLKRPLEMLLKNLTISAAFLFFCKRV